MSSRPFRPEPPSSVRSSQQVRGVNSSVVLRALWDSAVQQGLTSGELIELTQLSRATVLAICDNLRRTDWVREDRAPSPVPGRGRQARRFAFNAERCFIVGSDLGLNSVTSVVADLRGAIRGRVRHRTDLSEPNIDRTAQLIRSIDEVLQAAGIDAGQVSAGCVGVAAAVDRTGAPLPGNPFWDHFRLDLPRLRLAAPWSVTVENDANLAALAEFHAVPGAPSPFVALLSGGRFGAGVVVGSQILRGAHGGAGEMAYLDRVRGVEHPDGLLQITRTLLQEARMAGRDCVLDRTPTGGEDPILEDAFAAADAGDAVALEILAGLAERLALTIASFAEFVDPARVVVAGGVAELAERLLPAVRTRLAELLPAPPEVVSSTLGRDVVAVGAVRSAIAQVRLDSLSR